MSFDIHPNGMKVRGGIELDSEPIGHINKGTEFVIITVAVQCATNAQGTMRLRLKHCQPTGNHMHCTNAEPCTKALLRRVDLTQGRQCACNVPTFYEL